jgi:type II secretory pathway pseudopilin PulG
MTRLLGTRMRCPLPARARDERATTLIELIAAMSILMIVLTGIASVFVSGSNSGADLDRRFQAQQTARLALETLRRDLHRACSVSPSSGPATSSITLALPNVPGPNEAPNCGAVTSVTWSVDGSRTLWRGGVKWATNLTTATPFTPLPASGGSLPDVSVDLSVAIDLAGSHSYVLTDAIYLRNGGRQ